MSVPPRLFARFVVALMCLVHVGLGIAANPGTHGRTTADGYLCGGHLAPAAIASLAGVVPDVFSEAYRQLTGSGEDCCSACPGCGPAAVPSSAAHRPAEALSCVGIAGTRLPIAHRDGVLKPPSTAPPAFS